jgi:hypothetical protein
MFAPGRRARRTVRLGALLVLVAVVVACGRDGDDLTSRAPVGGPLEEPRTQRLDHHPEDTQSFLLVSGETAVVVSAARGGRLVAWRATGGSFEEVATGQHVGGFLSLSAAAATDDHFVAVGARFDTHRPVAWRSDDGTSWEPASAASFAEPADINDLVASDEVLVGVGARRTAPDPSDGGFVPAAWRSTDGGASWQTVELPADEAEGSASQVVLLDDAVLALGRDGSEDVMWRSTDAGASWTKSSFPVEEGWWIADLAAAGDTLVAVGGHETPDEFRFLVLVSEDAGATWERVQLGGLATGMDEVWSVHARPDGFWIPGLREILGPPADDRCYVDFESCVHPPEPESVVLTSPDGRTWEVRDAGIIGSGVGLQETELATAADGRTWLLASGSDGLTVWSWTESPDFPAPEPTPVTRWPVPPEPMAGDTLVEGVRYRAPLYAHCGIEWIGPYNGDVWKQAEGDDFESGAGDEPPEDWPVVGQTVFGYVTLVAPDRIEYSMASGEVMATYAPAPIEDAPGGCA